jgi:2'-5' RNA ligase
MRRLAVCSFLELQPEDATFRASEIPLHVTIVGTFAFDSGTDAVVAAMGSVTHRLPVTARAGGDDLFGPNRDVPVTVVTDFGGIRDLHNALFDELRPLGCELEEPLFARHGFRPHITWVPGSQVEPGQVITLDSLSLIDLRPDGDPALRRVVGTA